jgi:hypothetical protein
VPAVQPRPVRELDLGAPGRYARRVKDVARAIAGLVLWLAGSYLALGLLVVVLFLLLAGVQA